MTEVKVDSAGQRHQVAAIRPCTESRTRRGGAQVKDATDVVVKIDPSIQLRTFLINATEKPFDDVRVRQAMAYGINRKAVTDVMTEGLVGPNSQWYPKGFVRLRRHARQHLPLRRRQGQATLDRRRFPQRVHLQRGHR